MRRSLLNIDATPSKVHANIIEVDVIYEIEPFR